MKRAPSAASFSLGAINAPGGAPTLSISTTFGRLTTWRQANLRVEAGKRGEGLPSGKPTLVPSDGFTALVAVGRNAGSTTGRWIPALRC
jgi:hypothetical protein